ncbi:MAG: MFS transporter [Armatimonadetes bacterium 55-13]|nr:MFS transporter [Armatimonadota bacterium]OJU64560.1 MAG: MFS transporter [Armatimonadetes bacterium 55-13]
MTRTSNLSATPALVGLSLAMLMSSLDTSIANASLPTLAQTFKASFQAVQWIVLAYLLTVTTLIVSVGRLGDVLGRKRLLILGTAIFTFASALCGLSPSLGVLILARAGQGLGAAMMMSMTLAVVGETVPKEKTGAAMGLLGVMSAVGTALGPSLGGILTSYLGWRTLFLVNLPIGVAALVLIAQNVPMDQGASPAKRMGFDGLGTTLLGITLAAYALAMTWGRGQFGPLNMALLLATSVGLVLFLLVQRRVKSPLIHLNTFREPILRGGLLGSLLVSTVLMSTLVVGPFYLSRALHLNAAQVGFALSVGPVVVALSGIPAGRMSDRWGAQRLVFFGLFGVAIGSLLMVLLPTETGILGYLLAIVVMTSGYSAFQTANNAMVIGGIELERRGVISGMLNLSRNLGLITGTSVMGAIFSITSASDSPLTSPGQLSFGLRMTFAVGFVLMVIAIGAAFLGHRATKRKAPLRFSMFDEHRTSVQ